MWGKGEGGGALPPYFLLMKKRRSAPGSESSRDEPTVHRQRNVSMLVETQPVTWG